MSSYAIIFTLSISFICSGLINLNSQIFSYSELQNRNSESSIGIKTSSGSELIKGVSLSPINYSTANFLTFFEKAKEAGTCLTWGGNWDEFYNNTLAPSTAYNVTNLFLSFGFTPIIIIHTNTPEKIINNSTRKDWVKAYVKTYKPKYFGIGNEINGNEIYNKTNGAQAFYNFTKLFNVTYQIIKDNSPDTKIFTIFQLEYMKGLQGGLFNNGGNDTIKLNDWSLMNNVSKADFFAFTTYPCLIFKNPEEMPTNYYSEIKAYTNKSIAFTEIGWFWEGYTGWESTKQEEANFINRYFNITKGLNIYFNIWAFLYNNSNIPAPFNKMALLSIYENTSPAWVAWTSAGKSNVLPIDDDDDDDDEKGSESIISGYNIIFLTIGISIAIVIITINRIKIKKNRL